MSTRDEARWRRKMRVRKKIKGSSERPRLSVFRSNMHIYAQLIDDGAGKTIASVSTLSPKFREKLASASGKKEKAMILGEVLAELAKQRGIERAVFDKRWYRYHGRVRALAEGAKKAGLEF